MARTKQTARKSQGASAPRVSLSFEEGVLDTGRRITRLSVQKGNHFTIVWLGPTDCPSDLCIRCHNGGTLLLCETCDVGTCTMCLIMDDPNEPYICIRCWDSDEPYPHEITGEHAVRTSVPRLNFSKTAIISFVLGGSDEFGDPTKAAFEALASYLRGNVVLFEIVFDFTSKAGVKKSIEQLVEELNSHDHQDINRFLVSINSHSDPARGDIHTSPNNKASAPLGELLAFLLPPQLRAILKRGSSQNSSNIFFLHSCGSVVRLSQPRNDLKVLASSQLFNEVVAFDQEHLQPALAYGFMTDACRSYFVYNWSSITGVLADHHVFGAHTGLVLFTPDATTKFIWSHPVRRPFGQRISVQCKACKRDKGFTKERHDPGSQTKPKFDKKLRLRCKHCRVETLYSKAEDAKWFGGHSPAEDHHGAWLMSPVSDILE
ncbi:hypothetical protein BKA70DRAFT_1417053 [Coprinopsis sp. MPI-PUGE-AT-0042]|nr:hypothetical protein BKA70DRAFT_1417053 [Coprinopsis sp. MPI-PUGE-AT-0042]